MDPKHIECSKAVVFTDEDVGDSLDLASGTIYTYETIEEAVEAEQEKYLEAHERLQRELLETASALDALTAKYTGLKDEAAAVAQNYLEAIKACEFHQKEAQTLAYEVHLLNKSRRLK